MKKLYLDELIDALDHLGMGDVATYLSKPRFTHLLHPEKRLDPWVK